jgi:hypothetical protein
MEMGLQAGALDGQAFCFADQCVFLLRDEVGGEASPRGHLDQAGLRQPILLLRVLQCGQALAHLVHLGFAGLRHAVNAAEHALLVREQSAERLCP